MEEAQLFAKNGKKGSLFDLAWIVVSIFTFAIIVLFISLLLHNFNDKVQNMPVFPSEAKTVSEDLSTGFPETLNTWIVVAFFLACAASLILASLTPVHPAFLIIYVIEYLLVIWMGGAIANIYQAIIENNVFSAIKDSFPFTTAFFHYFPFIIGVVGIILMIVVYKARGQLW